MTDIQPVPDDLLSRLVGAQLYSVEFRSDYLQLSFDDLTGGAGPVLFDCYVWPLVEQSGRSRKAVDLGYADALRKLLGGAVVSAAARTGAGIRIELETGTVVLHPSIDEIHLEIAFLRGFADNAWMAWRPGEEGFEDLA